MNVIQLNGSIAQSKIKYFLDNWGCFLW